MKHTEHIESSALFMEGRNTAFVSILLNIRMSVRAIRLIVCCLVDYAAMDLVTPPGGS